MAAQGNGLGREKPSEMAVRLPALHSHDDFSEASAVVPEGGVTMCFGMGCEHEDKLTGECGYRGRGYYPCNDWGDEAEEDASPEGEEE